MNWLQALDIVITRTGHERYRWLCSNENPDARSREQHRAYMIRLAGGPAPEPPPQPAPDLIPSELSIRAARLGFRSCFYSEHEGCGCSGTYCYRIGQVVDLRECIRCLGLTEREAK